MASPRGSADGDKIAIYPRKTTIPASAGQQDLKLLAGDWLSYLKRRELKAKGL